MALDLAGDLTAHWINEVSHQLQSINNRMDDISHDIDLLDSFDKFEYVAIEGNTEMQFP
jgi:hypothetical protein